MNNRLRFLLLIIALAAGFANALLAAGVHSTFFILLPILAFTFGYFSGWRWGLLSGFLLFLSYTFTTALMWEVRWAFLGPVQYIGAFVSGGFSLMLLGALALNIRKGFKNIWSIVTLVILAGTIAGCFYISIPRYRYNYGLNILCAQDMEIYLPVATANDTLSTKLLDNSEPVTGSYPPDWYDMQLTDTEYGQMWHLKMYSFLGDNGNQIGRSSNLYVNSLEIRSWPGWSPDKMVRLSPQSDKRIVSATWPDNLAWPSFITATITLEEFNVPIKVITDSPTEFDLFLYCSIDRITRINFAYRQEESYSERIEHYRGATGEDWIMIPAEAIHTVNIRGIGD
jgi:hypothetical protein